MTNSTSTFYTFIYRKLKWGYKKVQKNEEEIIVKNTWIFNVVHLYQERKTRRSDLKNKQGTQDKEDFHV